MDIPFFEDQITQAAQFRTFALVSYDLVKDSVERTLRQQYERQAAEERAKGGPQSAVRAAVRRLFADSAGPMAHKKQAEIIARATYIYACTAFESLLGVLVRKLTRWEPQRIVPKYDKLAVKFLCDVASGKWSHEQLVTELETREAASFGKKSLDDQIAHITSKWDVAWPQDSIEEVKRVVRRRDSAAHDWQFAVPTDDEINNDLVALVTRGRELVEAVRRRTGQAGPDVTGHVTGDSGTTPD
jgi:hypothetical protein